MKYFLALAFLALAIQAETRRHAETTITFPLPAPPAAALPLFGPVRETEWEPHWNPQFLYPAGGSQQAGAVFTTKHGDTDAVWTLATYDESALRVAYVIVWPGMCLTKLDIELKPAPNHTSEATVTYRQTALSEAGDRFVQNFADHFPAQRDHWRDAISAALRKQ